MIKVRVALIVLVAALLAGQPASAQQSLTLSLLERYFESLREQAAMPGLSAAVLQNGVVVWSHGFGKQDVDGNIGARTDTPYAIAGLSQVLGTTVLLKKCVQDSYLEVSDRILRWDPTFGEPQTTVRDLLTHTAPSGGYHFDLSRFGALTRVIDQCSSVPYTKLIATEIFDRFGMINSVPTPSLATPTPNDLRLFDTGTLSRYASVVRNLATPYRVVGGRATKSEFSASSLDMSVGVISTVDDLARFDSALSHGLLDRDTLLAAWSRGGSTPMGLGWFVQSYNNEPVVWQFGQAKDAYSSLMVKLPNRDMTLILLANSDGLSAPYSLASGDVTASPFAKTFLRLITGS